MTTKQVARCGIYSTRPEICKVYPKVDQYTPPACTYYFKGEEREGNCGCNTGACCATPRQNGEPGGAPMLDVSGGLPCKHLEWVEHEEPVEKTAEPLVKIARQTSGEDLERFMYGTLDGD